MPLQRYNAISNGDMSGNLTSPAVDIEFMKNIGVEFISSGAPSGSFQVQVSIDYNQDSRGNVLYSGNWVPIDLDPEPVAAGVGDVIYVNIESLSAPWVRVVYDRLSGSGTLNAWICGK